MSSDSNPVKGFRSLSGSKTEQDAKNSKEKKVDGDQSTSAVRSPSSASPRENTPKISSPKSLPWTSSIREKEDQPKTSHPTQNISDHNSSTNGPNPDTAYVIELVGGLFGLFGLGYMYAGQSGPGTVRLIIGICCNVFVGVLAAITAGIFACLVLPIYIVVAIISAASVKKLLINQYQSTP